MQGWEWIGLVAVMGAALAVRLYALDRVPPIVIHDECDNLVNAYQILNGRGPGFFGLDWKPQPAASVYLLTLFVRGSESLVALRLPAALFSVAALALFFLLLRRAVAPPAALLAAALLATETWYLHFSRTGWENIYACVFLLAAALCMERAIRTGAWRSFACTGVWCALGLYGPFAGRTILPAMLLIGCAALWRPAVPRRRLLAGMMVIGLVTSALFAPQVPSVVADWDGFQKRTRVVYLLGGQNAARSIPDQIGLVLAAFGRKTYQLFAPRMSVGREPSNRYLRIKTGALSRPIAIALAVGLILGLFRRAQTWQWWILLLIPFVLTQALTIGSLNGARGIIFVPVLYLFIGLTVHAVWTACERIAPPLVVIVALGILALAVSSTRQYFEWAQSRPLLDALDPAIPAAEYPEWRAFVAEWTRRRPEFYNLHMWNDRQMGDSWGEEKGR